MRTLVISGLASLFALACSASDGTPRPSGLSNSDCAGSCVEKCICEGTSEALCTQHCAGNDPGGGNNPGSGNGNGNGAGGADPGGAAGAGAGDSGATGGETAQPTNCEYPSGASGVKEGAVVMKALKWQGFRAGTTQEVTIPITDYLDCDGSKGINALLISTGALWCPNCNTETSEFDHLMQTKWAAMGIKILSLVIEDH